MMQKLVLSVLGLSVLFAPAAVAQEGGNPLDKAPSQFAKLDDMKVHYKSIGDGKNAIVLVHGWTGNLELWHEQVPPLAEKMRIILIDLPGHGKSDKPKTDYTMELFAKAIEAVLRDAGVEKAVLAGHSMGTPVVRQYYRLYPEKTLGIIVVDGRLKSIFNDPDQVKQIVQRFEGPQFKENAEKLLASMFTESTSEQARKMITESLFNTPPHVAGSAMKGMVDPSIWKDDPIKVPLLLILAKAPYWDEEYLEYVKKLAPHAEVRMIDNAGHFVFMDQPRQFNAILMEFLNKQKLGN